MAAIPVIILLFTICTFSQSDDTSSRHSIIPNLDETYFECLDKLEDFKSHGWTTNYASMAYAPDTTWLPDVLKNNLEGNGIFFYEGSASGSQNFRKNASHLAFIQPIYMYIRYYGHFTETDSDTMSVYPVAEGSGKLAPTSNFTWTQQIFELDAPTILQYKMIRTGTGFLWPNDYFLIDKIILAQGFPQNDLEDLIQLCPDDEEGGPPTSTPMSPQTYHECLDILEDFGAHGWTTNYASMAYAPDTTWLPDDLKWNLEGNGIFYYEGSASGSQNFRKNSSHFAYIQPIFMYIRYYGHFTKTDSDTMYAYPVAEGSGELAPTSNFTWAEKLMELDAPSILLNKRIVTGTGFLWPNDYFLIDKIILAQGYSDNDLDDLKQLCPDEGDGPDTTTVVTTTTESTEPSSTTSPVTNLDTTTETTPGEFVCQDEGSFPDPLDCSIFHVCQFNDAGDLWDTIFQCPAHTVYCPQSKQCEHPTICPCTIHGFKSELVSS